MSIGTDPGRSLRPGRLPPPRSERNGYSIVELMFVLGLAATVTGVAIPQALSAVDEVRTFGAVRYLVSRIHLARMEAVGRSNSTAFRFVKSGTSITYGAYADGNRNGIRTADIADGIDPVIQREERLSEHFPGVDFGALPGLPPVDPSGTAPGSDPIRLGSSDLLIFSPIGTATAGSLYVRGPRNAQYVIRVFGETGRTRMLKFDVRARQWRPL